MTFEQWWENDGKEKSRELYRRPANSFSDIEATLREAAHAGWSASKFETMTPFERWLEMHDSECREQRYNEKCFEVCWNAAVCEAEHDLVRQMNSNKAVLSIAHLKNS
jgi:hypothetical protein